MGKFLSFFITIMLLTTACKSHKITIVESKPEPEPEPVIEVKEPEFNIVSIMILQADLVNTEFETVLKINNPNEFAVELSSLSYKLYGNNLFWAEGTGKDILQIPAQKSCETQFKFSMNFINMNRKILDDVIAMRNVRYRFKGEAEVQPVIPRVRDFTMSFDCSGFSEVKQGSRNNGKNR